MANATKNPEKVAGNGKRGDFLFETRLAAGKTPENWMQRKVG
jgi:hypothetical protein